MIPKVTETLDANGNVISTSRLNQERTDNKKSTFNVFDSYKSIAITSKSILNADEYEFNERFSGIISEAIMKDNRNLLSPEQRKLIDRYFSTAPDSTGIPKTEVEIHAILLSGDLIALDKYLGEV